MKKTKLHLILAALLLVAAGCTDTEMNMSTMVNRDGSCSREVAFITDSATLVGSNDLGSTMSYLVEDSLWEKSWRYKDDTAHYAYPMSVAEYDSLAKILASQTCGNKSLCDTVLLCVKRDFTSVEEMAEASPFRLAEGALKSSITLSKRFKWFYTDYLYSETYPSQEALFRVPLSDYVDSTLAAYWFVGQEEKLPTYSPYEKKILYDDIEKKVDKWLLACWINTACDVVADNYNALPHPPVSREHFDSLRDSITEYAASNNMEMMEDVTKIFSGYFHSDAYNELFAEGFAGEEAMGGLVEQMLENMTLQVDAQLVLPGRITYANIGVVGPLGLSYRVSGVRMIPGDYTVTTQSRATNVWAFLLSGLIIGLAIVSFLLPIRRRK